MEEAFLDIERKGYNAGANPLMGSLKRTFRFPPVSYANKSEQKAKFREQIRSELKTTFVFNYQVTLTVTLYLNHEKLLETPEYGDLDNYAKAICDAIKGQGGVLIDDCQIQRLDICFIDTPKDSYFEIEIQGNPDDFCCADLKLYEMKDGLFYPISEKVWEAGEFIKVDPINKYFQFLQLAAMTSTKRTLRHRARHEGSPQYRAFQSGRRVSPIQWSFHQTRIADAGYSIVKRPEWEADYAAWAAHPNNLERAQSMEEMIKTYSAELLLAGSLTTPST
jgi:Holliday junction resolvase RusA-like endonuclease